MRFLEKNCPRSLGSCKNLFEVFRRTYFMKQGSVVLLEHLHFRVPASRFFLARSTLKSFVKRLSESTPNSKILSLYSASDSNLDSFQLSIVLKWDSLNRFFDSQLLNRWNSTPFSPSCSFDMAASASLSTCYFGYQTEKGSRMFNMLSVQLHYLSDYQAGKH